jgi:TonB-dependent starch-binding outer membrane protein SusC
MTTSYKPTISFSFLGRLATVCTMLLLSHQVLAQTKTVTGVVTNAEAEPLPGVTIVVKGTTNGTVTLRDGDFSLPNLSEADILIFSFTGMKSVELTVGNRTTIDVRMEDDITQLGEIIVVGYGTQDGSSFSGRFKRFGFKTKYTTGFHAIRKSRWCGGYPRIRKARRKYQHKYQRSKF